MPDRPVSRAISEVGHSVQWSEVDKAVCGFVVTRTGPAWNAGFFAVDVHLRRAWPEVVRVED